MADVGLDAALATAALFHPVAAGGMTLRALAEIYLGYNIITGDRVNARWRAMEIAMTLLPSGNIIRKIAQATTVSPSIKAVSRRILSRIISPKESGLDGSEAAEPWTEKLETLEAGEEFERSIEQAAAEFDFSAPDSQTGNIRWGAWEQYTKTNIKGRDYALISGRAYTRHAIDKMLPR
jgi:hypothetical protein